MRISIAASRLVFCERRKEMFCEGEYVVYGLNGVCRIEGITNLDMDDIPKEKKYYALSPINQRGKIYVAVDSGQDKMRKIITKTEAEDLILKLQEIEPLKIKNDKAAEEIYKKSLQCFDCTEWVRLIKYIYEHNQNRLTSGKKVTAKDEKYMCMAEDALYSELGIALGIPREQVLEYILTKVKNINESKK